MDRNQEIISRIEQLFYGLPVKLQVYTLVELYESMSDGQKDKFLKETEN